MEAEQVLVKINNGRGTADFKSNARRILRLDAKAIASKKVEVIGTPASAVADEEAHWGPRREATRILFDRGNSIFINIKGLRRRPYTHTYEDRKWGNPIVYVRFEYCLEDAQAIRARWNAQRPNNRSRPWKKEEGRALDINR